jgi:hypothetical protein
MPPILTNAELYGFSPDERESMPAPAPPEMVWDTAHSCVECFGIRGPVAGAASDGIDLYPYCEADKGLVLRRVGGQCN